MSSEEERQSTRSAIQELTRLAYIQLQKGDNHKAIEYFESAAERAKEEGDPCTIISCYLNVGACYVSQGQLKRGIKFLQFASKLAKSRQLEQSDISILHTTIGRGDSDGTSMTEISADVYYNLAVAYQGMNEYKKAASHFKSSIHLYIKAKAILQAAESFMSLATCYRMRKESKEVVTSLTSAQELYHQLGDNYNEAGACVELCKVYFGEGKLEDCKQMLSTAKMLCLRVDNRRLQGKLYTQFGLLYTSLGLLDLGIWNFEQALPLVRTPTQTDQSLQTEACILQNIGAAYNEKTLFSEALVYHREAADIHGKMKNHNSESKCLCNLAFAQTQLNQLQEAFKSFSNALAKAHQAKNNYLQFQTCEGLGSISYQTGKYGEAVSYFEHALALLEQIKEDTGIARERVMEKLSEASEALQQMKSKQAIVRDNDTNHDEISDLESITEDAGLNTSEGIPPANHFGTEVENRNPQVMGSPSPELAKTPIPPDSQERVKKLSLMERRGVGTLPPIGTGENAHISETKPPPTHKHAVLVSKKGKKRLPLDEDENIYNSQLQAYMNSYRDSSTSLNSSQESLAPRKKLNSSLPKHPGVSPQANFLSESFPPFDAHLSSTSGSRHVNIREGSLAIGPNAREKFTVQTVEEESRGRRGKTKHRTESEIIPSSPVTPASQRVPQRQQLTNTSANQHSKVCIIL